MLAALHVTPEAAEGGPIARLRDGDIVRVDAPAGRIEVRLDPAEWAARAPARRDPHALEAAGFGVGRELFTRLRAGAAPADRGGSIL